ncbi:hypothetical protein THASP1DRAFT_27023 [Thamnocephalis sphaerospora]|uniref:Calpain catalytic domain-containing protein n=1 Tax=Thamnocephalis sphaerospora TaxID=78915 RepID=A0A4P9XXR5_9FUNG|nr:hypothetical protein THASP1DRAFT_27023 [Thamnocephalis sphaerospora]|eukprot:RKP11186.1 hypothetical protein THASP1DRAFT_27023 [Thamnocephalis sphaerospora]
MKNRPVFMPHRYLGQNYLWQRAVQRCRYRPWIDPLFPPDATSLGPRFAQLPGIVWRRPWEITRQARLYTCRRRCYQTGVIQGAVGNCWLVTTIGLVAQQPELMRRLVPFIKRQDWRHKNHRKVRHFHPSVYRFQFYRLGRWVEVLVDDLLPYNMLTGQLLFARSTDPDEFWVSLVEKAYAKLLGSYSALDSGSAADAMLDFTSAVVESWPMIPPAPVTEYGWQTPAALQLREEWQHEVDGRWKQIRKDIDRGALISCAIIPEDAQAGGHWTGQTMAGGQQMMDPDGLMPSHSYGVLDAVEAGTVPFPLNLFPGNAGRPTHRLLLLMDPWGEANWRGRWSVYSDVDWHQLPWWQYVRLRNRANRQSGIFWISFEDFLARFNVIQVGRRVNTRVFSFRRRWSQRRFQDCWSGERGTAGGCTNFDGSVQGNPQYLVIVDDDETEMLISLQQGKRLKGRGSASDRINAATANGNTEMRTVTATHHIMPDYEMPPGMQGNFVIGFVLMRVEENRRIRLEEPRDVVASGSYQNSREVTLRIRLKAGRYVLLPTTFAPGEEADFLLRVFSSPPARMSRLLATGIEPPLWRRALTRVTTCLTYPITVTRGIGQGSFKPQPVGYLSVRIVQAVFPSEYKSQRAIEDSAVADDNSGSNINGFGATDGDDDGDDGDGYDSDTFCGCLPFFNGPPFRAAYLIIGYAEDSGSRIRREQPLRTRPARIIWKKGGLAVWNIDYIFPVFDPLSARVQLQVIAAMRLARDEALGTVALTVDRFATPDRAGATWEMVLPIEPNDAAAADAAADASYGDVPLQPAGASLGTARHMVTRVCYRPVNGDVFY